MATKAERTRLHQLDRQIRSLVAEKVKIQTEKDKQLLAVDWEIEKVTTQISKILMECDDSEDEGDEIKKGNSVKITGGVKSTVNMVMTVDKITKCYYWLEDEEGKIHRRAKTNVIKIVRK